jgi:hypothetical protein
VGHTRLPAGARTLATTTLALSLGSFSTISPRVLYSGVMRLQWPHLGVASCVCVCLCVWLVRCVSAGERVWMGVQVGRTAGACVRMAGARARTGRSAAAHQGA